MPANFAPLFIALLLSAVLPIVAFELLVGGFSGTRSFYLSLLGLSVAVAAALAAVMLARTARGSGDGRRHMSASALMDEGRDGGQPDAPDLLVARVKRQSQALSALAEIDRAILSRTGSDLVMRSVLKNARSVIACDILAITILATDTKPQTQTIVVGADGDGAPYEDRVELEGSTLQFLTTEQNGCWAADASRFPFLAPVVNAGAKHVLLLPIFLDANLAAVLSVGLTGAPILTDEQRAYARDFADRFGVVLTAGARDESLYMEGHYDSLTTLPNRRFLVLRLAEELSRARRVESKFALLFIGLDEFKKVNDSIGHAGGDVVLKEAAQRLNHSLREQDIVVRFSGDQFVALLPALLDGVGAGKTAEKLITALSQPFAVRGEDYHLGASIGVSIFPDDGQDAEKLLRSADLAMSRAKAKGRGQYVFFEEQVNAEVFKRVSIERDLRQAIAQNQLVVMYQPQINLRTGMLSAAEALVRWRHPQRGFVRPDDFIAIAEQSRLIEHIGGFVRQTVCDQYRAWTAGGIALERISVNVSSREIRREDFVQNIQNTLRETGMRPFCLELEITESILVDDFARVLRMLKILHDQGVRIAIDDFGTGYSSLAYLRQLPFDVLKIDRAFVADIGVGDSSDAICSSIVGMAHALGKEVVAEGVETAAQRLFLAQIGCEVGQGYLWSPPASAQDFVQLVRNWTPAPHSEPLISAAGGAR